ncbi:P-loop containing nucleoside triphosphate hydrolase protein [Daedalea quercina L-15889]|uniref:DNA 3'-5' helicase n=1 Tax=Daedalea quercina L-15889 TaxID=1314783 RepID=A0A165NJC3_9APHY|nr:P-loop containing nucleoside triphosphate hydrolase protein [Daedalea quercina L-15889]
MIARAAAHKTRGYDSKNTRKIITDVASDAFDGKEPYNWQVAVCEAILLGLDCIVIAGTGAGKTMPFVMPLLVDETKRKMVVIISPLNELEEDQAKHFWKMGLTATAINKEKYTKDLHKHRVLLMGPEMALEHPHFSQLLRCPELTKDVATIVIDEAHCVSQWGDNLRKKFGNLKQLRALVPDSVPFHAVSATLPPPVFSMLNKEWCGTAEGKATKEQTNTPIEQRTYN